MYEILVYYPKPKSDRRAWSIFATHERDAIAAAESIARGERRRGGEVIAFTSHVFRNAIWPLPGYEDALTEYQAWVETQ